MLNLNPFPQSPVGLNLGVKPRRKTNPSAYAWKIIGTAGFGSGVTGAKTCIACSVAGDLCVSCINSSSVVSVYRYVGNIWTVIPNPASDLTDSTRYDLAVDFSGYPITTFSDISYFGNRLSCYRWDGSTGWASVGSRGSVSENTAKDPHIITDGTNYYVGYSDWSGSNYGVSVRRWNGSSWAYIGARYSGGGAPSTSYTCLAIYKKDNNIAVFCNTGTTCLVRVWDGSNWSATATFSATAAPSSGSVIFNSSTDIRVIYGGL